MDGPAERDDPRIGMLVQDRYRIVRKLGEGGMGSVYEVRHELIGRRLALKCLHAHFTRDAETVERFHREAKAATAIGHEHIIEVTDMGQFPDGSPYIVLEYLEGLELAQLMQREGPLPLQRLAHIAVQVCSALRAAHDKGIIHRDLKPENIFLIPRRGDDDFVKVLDFGISKMKETAEKTQRSLTQSGTALGTPYYMAPEQARALPDIDHRADVYALGVILYEAASHCLPFDAESYPALMVKILTDEPRHLRQLRPDLPETFAGIVMHAMARDREQRFQSMEQLSQALAPFATGTSVPSLDATRPISAPPEAWSSRPPAPPPSQPGVRSRGTSHDSSASPPRSPARRTTALLMGLAVALAIAATLWVSGMLGPATQPAPSLDAEAPQESEADRAEPEMASDTREPTGQTPTPQRHPASPPEEVRVRIRAEPDDARIYIDGVEFPNPTDAYRPRSLEPVRIRVARRGYRNVEQLAIFDRDRSFSYELERGRGTRELPRDGATEAEPTPPPEPHAQQGAATARTAEPPRSGKAEAAPSERAPEASDPTASAVSDDAPDPDNEPAQQDDPAPSDDTYRGPTGELRDEF